jgi:hypothetical protein
VDTQSGSRLALTLLLLARALLLRRPAAPHICGLRGTLMPYRPVVLLTVSGARWLQPLGLSMQPTGLPRASLLLVVVLALCPAACANA